MRVIAVLLLLATIAFGVYEFRTRAAVRTSDAQVQVLRKAEARIKVRALPTPVPRRPVVVPQGAGAEHGGGASATEPAQVPVAVTEARVEAEAQQAAAAKQAATAGYMRIGLTVVLVPFCMFLVLKRRKDAAATGFSFTSMGLVIAYWLHAGAP